MIRDRTVARRRAPPDSAFLGDLRTFHYWDSYEAPLVRGDLRGQVRQARPALRCRL